MAIERIALQLRATRSPAQERRTLVRARQGANTALPLKDHLPPACCHVGELIIHSRCSQRAA